MLPTDDALAKLIGKLDQTRRGLMREAISRGIRRGEFAGGDVEILIDAILGAVYLRFLVLRKPITRRYVDALVRSVLAPA